MGIGTMEHKKLPTLWRILNFVLMLPFLGFALLAGVLVFKSLISGARDWLSLVVSIISAWGFGWTAYLLGYKVFEPVSRHGWIKNKIGLMVPLMFVWALLLAAVAIPPYNQYKSRAYDSAAKSNLHYMFVACQTYWKAKGSNQNCDLNITTQKEYGYVPFENVTIAGKGTAKDFTAKAQHQDSANVFIVDAQGKITKAKHE
jgi:Tfp pilus assembly protein PilE